jgi:7-cyano-7-deazaguanine synthase in queuosine biosynthesis
MEEYIDQVKKSYHNYDKNLNILEDMLFNERGYVYHALDNGEGVVVLLSGGLDSSIMTGVLLHEYDCVVHPLYVKRGSKNEKYELSSAEYFVNFYQEQYGDKISDLYVFEAEVPPKEFKQRYCRAMIDTVGYPLRNSTLQNYAVMYATIIGVHNVFVGSVGEDYMEPESGLLSLRAKTVEVCIGRGDWGWQITSPLIEPRIVWDWKITQTNDDRIYKPDLIYYAEQVHPVRIPYEESRSCFSLEEIICGTCSACTKREEALKFVRGVVKK